MYKILFSLGHRQSVLYALSLRQRNLIAEMAIKAGAKIVMCEHYKPASIHTVFIYPDGTVNSRLKPYKCPKGFKWDFDFVRELMPAKVYNSNNKVVLG